MSQLITITPKPGSRKFRVMGSGMTQYNQIAGTTNPGDVEATGEYKGQRFPNSRQMFKPKWSFSKRRWMLAGADKNSKKLNEIVARCKLKYEEGDPRYPGYITEADIFDFDDPFFKHPKLKIIAREGEFVLDKDVPKDKILIMAIQADHQFSLKGEGGGQISNRVKYLITDKNIDEQAKKNIREKELEAGKLYAALSDQDKIRIAMGMGLISKETEKVNLVDEMLWAAAKNTQTRAANGTTMQEYFIAMAKTSEEELNIRYLIQKARGEGHLKKTTDGYMLFGQPVGMSETQVYTYFKNPENRKLINRLNTVIETDPVPAPRAAKKEEDPLVALDSTEGNDTAGQGEDTGLTDKTDNEE